MTGKETGGIQHAADDALPSAPALPASPADILPSTRPSSAISPSASSSTGPFDAESHPRRPSYFIPMSLAADATLNPIRAIVDRIRLPTDLQHKPLIPLSIGDPTTLSAAAAAAAAAAQPSGNLDIPDNLLTSMISNLKSKRYNGYAPSTGSLPARQAIATRHSYPSAFSPASAALPPCSLTAADVIITSGCSHALTIAIESLCDPGTNILLPRPGFSLYRTIVGRNGIVPRFYPLLSERRWEADLQAMEALIDDSTRAILVNNPSNPNGSNWSLQHISDIIAVAQRHRLPIIADEVYADMVFEGESFFPFAAVSSETPVIAVGGTAKQFVCPGWRLGWLLIYDKGQQLSGWREGISNMSQLIIGSNTLVQSCLPDLLLHTPTSYSQRLLASLQRSARCLYAAINTIPCLSCSLPQGAMYVMVRVDSERLRDIGSEEEFATRLLQEENVFVLPGTCFQAPGFVRLVCCAPVDVMEEAVHRMREFCIRHAKEEEGGAGAAAICDSVAAPPATVSGKHVEEEKEQSR